MDTLNTSPFPEQQKSLLEGQSLYVRLNAACNPNTSPGMLAMLAKDSNNMILKLVASNPNTPSEVLADLSKNPEDSIRILIASNPSTPSPILTTLSNDSNQRVAHTASLKLNPPNDDLFPNLSKVHTVRLAEN